MPLSHELQSLCRVSLSCDTRLLNISDCRTLDIECFKKSDFSSLVQKLTVVRDLAGKNEAMKHFNGQTPYFE